MNFQRHAQERSGGFQMAPMLDIVFILLIHFMAATIFAQWENKLDISVPTATESRPGDRRQQGEVILNIDRNGKVFINSMPISDDSLLNLLDQISATFKSQPILIRADRDTSCQSLLHVLDICRKADIWNISFATIKPEDAAPPAPPAK